MDGGAFSLWHGIIAAPGQHHPLVQDFLCLELGWNIPDDSLLRCYQPASHCNGGILDTPFGFSPIPFALCGVISRLNGRGDGHINLDAIRRRGPGLAKLLTPSVLPQASVDHFCGVALVCASAPDCYGMRPHSDSPPRYSRPVFPSHIHAASRRFCAGLAVCA